MIGVHFGIRMLEGERMMPGMDEGDDLLTPTKEESKTQILILFLLTEFFQAATVQWPKSAETNCLLSTIEPCPLGSSCIRASEVPLSKLTLPSLMSYLHV